MSNGWDLRLEDENLNDERIRVGLEYFAARKSGFATEADLRRQLARALPLGVELQPLLDQLGEPELARAATALVVSELLKDEQDSAMLRDDIEQASKKLAVVETALGVLLIMYTIHYIATGGVDSEVVKRELPDGTVEKRSIIYQKPTDWLATVVKLFGVTGGNDPGRDDKS